MSRPPGEERLFDGMAAGDQLLILADEIGRGRAAGRARPVRVGAETGAVRATGPRGAGPLPEGTAIVATGPDGPRGDGAGGLRHGGLFGRGRPRHIRGRRLELALLEVDFAAVGDLRVLRDDLGLAEWSLRALLVPGAETEAGSFGTGPGTAIRARAGPEPGTWPGTEARACPGTRRGTRALVEPRRGTIATRALVMATLWGAPRPGPGLPLARA